MPSSEYMTVELLLSSHLTHWSTAAVLNSNYMTDRQQGVRHHTIPHQEKPPITLLSKLDLVTKMHQATPERTSKGSRFSQQIQDEHVLSVFIYCSCGFKPKVYRQLFSITP